MYRRGFGGEMRVFPQFVEHVGRMHFVVDSRTEAKKMMMETPRLIAARGRTISQATMRARNVRGRLHHVKFCRLNEKKERVIITFSHEVQSNKMLINHWDLKGLISRKARRLQQSLPGRGIVVFGSLMRRRKLSWAVSNAARQESQAEYPQCLFHKNCAETAEETKWMREAVEILPKKALNEDFFR